ncbi:hypothetical protein SODALDRAFT_362727 [Sodiomyces alkalinus F11]|uniref:CCHC-type domain-containing protein n=1 Tax=Sodiomyces alkalinus (strain CBS 110278 / VKM F-3762 / F11) TaxID=1314773 RepID=A0A3N2PMY0_SODAK|nr:hypothetical protein SODALDRAFT_362727 [Sodiomyces alkalinus F11]ROT35878.1 hypothetical protein SODALDRAFT_362727 [Sodiomyces alkalinus F11]
MSSGNMAPETPPSRGISSRLLTMKFMQRAAAAESAASTPASDSSSTKRRKVDNSPLTGEFHSFDEAAIEAALKQQEAVRQAALVKHKADLADTQWVLDDSWVKSKTTAAQPSRDIEYVSFAQIDAADGREDEPPAGRRIVGNYKTADHKNPDNEESSDDSSSSDDNSDGESPKRFRQRADGTSRRQVASSSKQALEAENARGLRDKRKQRLVNLNKSISGGGGISSISSGGGVGGFSRGSNFTCHTCGQQGHKMAECPNKQRRKSQKQKSSR